MLIHIVVVLLIVGVLLALIHRTGIVDGRIVQVIDAVVLIFVIVWIVGLLFPNSGIPHWGM